MGWWESLVFLAILLGLRLLLHPWMPKPEPEPVYEPGWTDQVMRLKWRLLGIAALMMLLQLAFMALGWL